VNSSRVQEWLKAQAQSTDDLLGRYEIRSCFSPVSGIEEGKLLWKPLTRQEDQAKDSIIYKEKVYVLTRKGAPNNGANWQRELESYEGRQNETTKKSYLGECNCRFPSKKRLNVFSPPNR
jgi:hypothetical protein